MKFVDFATTYKDFYVPHFELLVGGKDAVRSGMEIVSVTVDNTLDAADQASFTVSNAFDVENREIRWFDQELRLDGKLEVHLGYTDVLQTIFTGVMTSIKVNFPSGGMPQLEVTAFDLSHPMTRNKKSFSWDNFKDSDIANTLASRYHLNTQADDKATVEDTQVQHRQTKQDNQSDFEFLKKRADEYGFEFFVFNGTLFFRKPAYEEEPVVELKWGETLMSFSPELNIADQVQGVEVRGWDVRTKREIVGRARVGEEPGREQGRQSGGQRLQAGAGEEAIERVRRPVYTQQEADNLAKSILMQITEGFVKGSGECLGLPELRAGKNVVLEGLGSKFSTRYYVEKTNHNISSSGYRTTFNVKEPTL